MKSKKASKKSTNDSRVLLTARAPGSLSDRMTIAQIDFQKKNGALVSKNEFHLMLLEEGLSSKKFA